MTFWAHRRDSVDELFDLLRNPGYDLFSLVDGELRPYTWLNERISNMFALPGREASLP